MRWWTCSCPCGSIGFAAPDGSSCSKSGRLPHARKVYPGRVIGVDMTDAMLAKATANAEALGCTNVEFRAGDIERLPVEDASIDVVLSNCVINLCTNKDRAFREIYRVLKAGG